MKQRKPSDLRNEASVTFGGALRKRREAAGLSMTKMAGKLDISPSHLSRLERDEIAHPSVALLLRIAKCFDMRPEDLYALTGTLIPSELPDLVPYLHAKHPNWPDRVVADLDLYCDFLKYKYSLD